MTEPGRHNGWFCLVLIGVAVAVTGAAAAERPYENRLRRIANPRPILADHPEFVQPVRETVRYEAPVLVDDDDADLSVRAWRFSYNARGIIEMPNRLRADRTALVVVHPWGIDDGQGWRTPEPAGVADFCTPEKNHLSHEHIRQVLNPFVRSLRGKVRFVMFSQPGGEDPIRKKLYRSIRGQPSAAERQAAATELARKLASIPYQGEPVPAGFPVSTATPVIDYFHQFPGLDASQRFNGKDFWNMPIPVVKALQTDPDDIVIYDADGYGPLRDFLQKHEVRHILLAGYATDMCYRDTTAGYRNLAQDFNVFLVGDATLATFPANSSPRYATNASLSFASLKHLITQVSWIRYEGGTEREK